MIDCAAVGAAVGRLELARGDSPADGATGRIIAFPSSDRRADAKHRGRGRRRHRLRAIPLARVQVRTAAPLDRDRWTFRPGRVACGRTPRSQASARRTARTLDEVDAGWTLEASEEAGLQEWFAPRNDAVGAAGADATPRAPTPARRTCWRTSPKRCSLPALARRARRRLRRLRRSGGPQGGGGARNGRGRGDGNVPCTSSCASSSRWKCAGPRRSRYTAVSA